MAGLKWNLQNLCLAKCQACPCSFFHTFFLNDINLILIFDHNGRPIIIVGLFGETKLTDSNRLSCVTFVILHFEFDSQVYPSLVAILGYPLLFMCHAASLLSAALFVIWLDKSKFHHRTHLPKLS